MKRKMKDFGEDVDKGMISRRWKEREKGSWKTSGNGRRERKKEGESREEEVEKEEEEEE